MRTIRLETTRTRIVLSSPDLEDGRKEYSVSAAVTTLRLLRERNLAPRMQMALSVALSHPFA